MKKSKIINYVENAIDYYGSEYDVNSYNYFCAIRPEIIGKAKVEVLSELMRYIKSDNAKNPSSEEPDKLADKDKEIFKLNLLIEDCQDKLNEILIEVLSARHAIWLAGQAINISDCDMDVYKARAFDKINEIFGKKDKEDVKEVVKEVVLHYDTCQYDFGGREKIHE